MSYLKLLLIIKYGVSNADKVDFFLTFLIMC